MNKLMYLWFAVKTVFCTCQPDHKINDFEKVRSQYKISKIGKLPAVASESSGLANGSTPGMFITHNDSGGKPEFYEFDLSGKLTSTITVPNAQNIDWEDLTKDSDGHLYVGDFGNNGTPRKQFEIYKFDGKRGKTEKISFHYADQKSVASVSEKPTFDCESLFYYQKSLYLFSKNWDKNKNVKLYRVPAEAGNYTLTAIDSIEINTQVTSADISPDGKTFALLTYGKILLFGIENNRIDFSKPQGCFRLVKKQNEALMFLNNTDMLVTNEQGNIYRITYK
ncbi:esterase-like activity of phytase family protein [Dyadobacter fanqingshengii]|uniref:Esterase-like activity of phytase family protein n=1 Tax=Dyadobacter fanqingshengii TaxID=2906443 RepID=A0A9X1P457_9BACT|nr:esterase-like activity of phytase family protein [Dyadobacter fanqingshengii]MCF0038491.1 esterase-like activity of phytase family protein [Dyadobacter fanqingshengii]USJ34675.1 esterase-like activity of phytase family protein [Dyadobacter fanqingshengii]